MASTISGQHAVASTLRASRAPAEGWVSVALHATLLVVMAGAIVRVERPERLAILVPLALGGGAIGFSLAKSRFIDLFAHVTAFAVGVVTAIGLAAIRYNDVGGGWRTSLDRLQARAEHLYQSLEQSKPLDDDLLVAVIGITIWLVGYSSAWMLYRRRWLGPATMLPGVVILTSLGLDRDAPAAPIFVYLVVAMVLAARHFAFRRQQDWRRARIGAPTSLPARFLAAGSLVGAIAVTIGIVLPVQAPDEVLDRIADRGEQAWQKLQQKWDDLPIGANRGNGPGSYADFPDEFRLGEALDLSNEEVAFLQADRPQYLALRRYNVYDGRNWSTDVDETFRFPNEDDDVHATRATFIPSQPVTLSREVLQDRTAESGLLTVNMQKGGLIFTIGTHHWTSEPTTVLLGWRRIDDLAIPVDSVDSGVVPVDLYALLSRLQAAAYEASPDGGEPTIVQPDLAADVAALRASLRDQYPLETRIELVDGRVILHVSGRLPIYDDIEAVFANDPNHVSSQYLVEGYVSTADPDDLRAAGTDYPAYVRSRYLGLPETVTFDTRQLSRQIVDAAGAQTPFDQAMALEKYLRTTYPYVLNSNIPVSGDDFVDDFLFQKKEGRCEEFATAMVVMLRSLDIPSRLVSGYHVGEFDPARNGFVYQEKQAHTWVEAFFPGYGWIPFEPTPSEDQFSYGQEQGQPTPTPEPSPTPAPSPTPEPSPTVEATASPVAGPVDPNQNDDSLYDKTVGRLPWLPTVISALTVIGAVGLVLIWLWGLRGLRPGAALYARTMRVGKLWGVQPDPTMTPAEYAAEFARTVPASRSAIRVVADLYTAEQYGNGDPHSISATTGQTAWRELRRSVVRWRPWRRGRRISDSARELTGD